MPGPGRQGSMARVNTSRFQRDLVLVGGGHAHVQVLTMLAMRAPPDVRLTLVSDSSHAYYSGMFPGLIAGLYRPDEVRMELRPLARWAGARFVRARVVDVDPEAREVRCEGHPPLRFDLASINVGSTTRGTEIPGAREYAVPTRPIADLYARVVAFEADHAGPGPRVVVVGGGAAGVELAFTLRARLLPRHPGTAVTLVDGRASPLEERGPWLSGVVRRELERRGIAILTGRRATRVAPGSLHLETGARVPFDLLVFATGGAAPAFLAESALATDADGFLQVDACLQTRTSPRVLGAGDCIAFAEGTLPKAGVYAVRQGPVLAENLLRLLDGRRPRPYRPQAGFLALLSTGDRAAIASWRGLVGAGGWAWSLKDWIDRRFMRRFDVAHMGPSPATMRSMTAATADPAAPMRCAGCGAKVGAGALREALAGLPSGRTSRVRLGLEEAEDAAVVEVPAGHLQVQTVDAFPAFLDDGYLVGRIAAVHAASDLFAMGATPETGLLTVTLPGTHPRRAGAELRAVLVGVAEELAAMGACLVGGHTMEGDELVVGLAMTGLLPADVAPTRKAGLVVGDQLVLTKALGTGVVLAADMQRRALGEWVDAAVASMLRSNREAATMARARGVRAMTDVTGFGLAGHLGEMLRASQVSACIRLEAIPHLPGALACLALGLRSTLDPDNRAAVADLGFGRDESPQEDLLFDPQTSGGLLLGVAPDQAVDLVARLREEGYPEAAVIGEVRAGPPRLEVERGERA